MLHPEAVALVSNGGPYSVVPGAREAPTIRFLVVLAWGKQTHFFLILRSGQIPARFKLDIQAKTSIPIYDFCWDLLSFSR